MAKSDIKPLEYSTTELLKSLTFLHNFLDSFTENEIITNEQRKKCKEYLIKTCNEWISEIEKLKKTKKQNLN